MDMMPTFNLIKLPISNSIYSKWRIFYVTGDGHRHVNVFSSNVAMSPFTSFC